MKEVLKNMSEGKKILFWNAIVMLISDISYIIVYMISGKNDIAAIAITKETKMLFLKIFPLYFF